MDLQTPVKNGSRVFKIYASRLEKLGIKKLEDFLYHIPARYEDYSLISKISAAQPGEIVTIQGIVKKVRNSYISKWRSIQKIEISDNTGTLEATWFNQPFILKSIIEEEAISVSGKIGMFGKKITMEVPEFEMLTTNSSIHTGRLVSIYPETKGISSKWLRRQIYNILEKSKQNIFEYLPDSILKNNDLIDIADAIEQIHFPRTNNDAANAKKRLSFDELFLIHLNSLIRKSKWKQNLKSKPLSVSDYRKNIKEFLDKLPFTLTRSQEKAVSQILKDLQKDKPMNRLLEGEVGSGKTVVGAIAMYLAYLNGYQSVLMAPTEILATQHYKTIFDLLSPFAVRVGLATGNNRIRNQELEIRNQKKRGKIHNSQFSIHNSNPDVVVGTHALLFEKTKFKRLGLVIIDEQQRFGVEQRAIIRDKGENPHLLTMTATPIPRTVALTLYGDLDVSYLDEMPKGRKTIKTWLVPREKRENAYRWIKSQIRTHKIQAFIICPFIEESENMLSVKAATKEYDRLKKEEFSQFKVGLLHGKLKSNEKDTVLQKFRNKEFDILVATPVVEVGIDIQNATIIMIEGSERFGLAGLHQLRGRVGRGSKQSYCLLFTQSAKEQTLTRLKAMETMQNGAELAELDLKLRGPGELYGTMQHGVKFLKIARFSDFELVEKTKKEAEKIFPKLSSYPLLLKKLQEVNQKKISPD